MKTKSRTSFPHVFLVDDDDDINTNSRIRLYIIYSSFVRNSIVIFDFIYFLPSLLNSFEINLRRIDCLNDEPNDFRVSPHAQSTY